MQGNGAEESEEEFRGTDPGSVIYTVRNLTVSLLRLRVYQDEVEAYPPGQSVNVVSD
jgi:hypothetical protein